MPFLGSKIFTIGYSGSTMKEVLNQLRGAKITVLADIREIPISRKPGFSKTMLMDTLRRNGIAYHHFRLLGSPKKARHAVRKTQDYAKFFSRVRRHLSSEQPKLKLFDILELARNEHVCLMCCCSDWKRCHRKCIVEALCKLRNVAITHLATVLPEG